MTIKMVATDIDGTILRYTGGFTDEVIRCIHDLESNNIKVVLVTGRMYRSSKKISDEIGLNTSIVAYQGGLVLDENGKVLYEKYIPNETTSIDPDAFENVNGLTIFGKAGSTAEAYANTHEGISFIVMS